MPGDVGRRCCAEGLGTCLLVTAVVGSGIMAARLSPGDTGLQLLENAAATAGALVALILTFAGISGAHFNPVVTLVARIHHRLDTRMAVAYVTAQIIGGCAGSLLAHTMFGLPTFELATKSRSSGPLWLSEAVATIGLLLIIHGTAATGHIANVAIAVAAWIGGAYWFTSSTSFANPAVTIARTLSNSFAGIAPSSAPMFVLMQAAGAVAAAVLIRYLFQPQPSETADV
jgi:glycerol uptake facilitator-like aquaporin